MKQKTLYFTVVLCVLCLLLMTKHLPINSENKHSYLVSVRLHRSLNQLMTTYSEYDISICTISVHQSYIRYPEEDRKVRCTTFERNLGRKLHPKR